MSAPTSTSESTSSSRVAPTFIPGFIEESSCTAADLFLDRKQDNLYIGTKRKWTEYRSDIDELAMSSEKPFKRVKATEVCVKSEVETIIARLEKRFDQFEQKNEGKITELQNKITEQQKQITEQQNQIVEQQKQITEQQKQITEIDTNWNFSLAYIQLTGEPRSNAKHLKLRVYEAFSTYLKNKNLQELQTALFPMKDFQEHSRLLNETLGLDIDMPGKTNYTQAFAQVFLAKFRKI